MIRTTLVVGGSPSAREAAIASEISSCPPTATAAILEGLPSGNSPLDLLQQSASVSPPSSSSPASLRIVRIAPGCPCCSGNLPMRVTLNRLLRSPPDRLFISMATCAHLEQVRAFLSGEPYRSLLSLTPELRVDWHA